MKLFDKNDWLGGALPGKDRQALPITVITVTTVGVAVFAPSSALSSWGVTAVHTVMCAACVLLLLRRGEMVSGTGKWFFANSAVLFNPFYEFRLYSREAWVCADIALAIALYMAFYRKEELAPKRKAIEWAFLVGGYVSWFVLGQIAVWAMPRLLNENPRFDELLVFPLLLAGITWFAIIAIGIPIGIFLLVSDFSKSIRR